MNTFWPAIERLLKTPEPPDLGPRPRAIRNSLEALRKELDTLFMDLDPPREAQSLIRAGVLLWHDHLDASHTLSQSIESADGSYLHAIMHRREPDYWNSKYWFRRVGNHAVFPRLADAVGKLAVPGEAKLKEILIRKREWDPCAFVDVCEQAAHPGADASRTRTLREIQALELRLLLEHFSSANAR